MPKDLGAPEPRIRNFPDQTLLHEAQLAFLEEVQARGGSLIATSHAFQMTSAEIARRACLLGLLSFWQATDYDGGRKKARNLPSYIALEDCLVALKERHGTFGQEENFLALQVGISKIKKEETWTIESFQAFLSAGEALFAECRDDAGVTSVFAPIGLEALDRTSCRILKDNPRLKEQLHGVADAQIEAYFDHLSEEEVRYGEFDLISVSRGERRSPAWITGKLLAMGLIHVAHISIDPVLHPETREETMASMDHSALSIARSYASKLGDIFRSDRSLRDANRHAMRLRLAAAEAGLRQLTELTARPAQVMTVLDHLDRAAKECGNLSSRVSAISFAGHTRLHRQLSEEMHFADGTHRN